MGIKQTTLYSEENILSRHLLKVLRTNFRKRAKVGGDKLLSKTETPETTREAGQQSTSGEIGDHSVVSFSEDVCSESSAGCL